MKHFKMSFDMSAAVNHQLRLIFESWYKNIPTIYHYIFISFLKFYKFIFL